MMMKYFQYDKSRNQPIRKLIKDFLTGRLLNNLADTPLGDDFFAQMAQQHNLTPIEKQKLHQQAQLFLKNFLNAENDETQLNALKQLVLDIFALKQQNKNEALKYQELHVPPLADFNPNDDRERVIQVTKSVKRHENFWHNNMPKAMFPQWWKQFITQKTS